MRNGDGRFGFIDKTGKLVIDFKRLPAGALVGEFSEGLASLCLRDDRGGGCLGFGFIDENGKVVIAPRFIRAGRFSEGLAYVETKEGAGFINHQGEMVIKLNEEEDREFIEGLAAVRTGLGWSFIDRSGKLITKERYTRVENFSEGLAAVSIGTGGGAKYGFINKAGEMVIQPQFLPRLGHHDYIAYLSRFAEGLARVKVNNLYGYIDRRGEFVIKPQFRDAEDFSEGLASVEAEDGKRGYIDKSGRVVLTLRDAARGESFKEGLAVALFIIAGKPKYGYIDRTGKVVIEPRFDSAFEFIEGVAEVYVVVEVTTPAGLQAQGKSAYINRAGNFIWKPQ